MDAMLRHPVGIFKPLHKVRAWILTKIRNLTLTLADILKKILMLWHQEKFFQDKVLYFKNFHFNYRFKIESKDNKGKYTRFSHTVSHKIDYTAFGVHRYHPSAWEWTFNIFYCQDWPDRSQEFGSALVKLTDMGTCHLVAKFHKTRIKLATGILSKTLYLDGEVVTNHAF